MLRALLHTKVAPGPQYFQYPTTCCTAAHRGFGRLSSVIDRQKQGAAAGAIATMFVGCYWGGWSLGSTADKMAKERSDLAVVSALAPVCADKFRALLDAEAKKVALSKVDSWRRRDEFPKELVTLPGESYPSSALVDACSTLLLAPKSAALK
jgi:hypothetical protein